MLFLDPVQEDSIELVKLAELFYKHKIPLRYILGCQELHMFFLSTCQLNQMVTRTLPENWNDVFFLLPLELDLCLSSIRKMRLMAFQMLELHFSDCWITLQTSTIYHRPLCPWSLWVSHACKSLLFSQALLVELFKRSLCKLMSLWCASEDISNCALSVGLLPETLLDQTSKGGHASGRGYFRQWWKLLTVLM